MQMKQLALIALLAGCAPSGQKQTDGGIAFDEKTVVSGLTIVPIELLEDSRCPENANCAWPGQVRIKVKWLLARKDGVVELTSIQPASIAGGALSLAQVRPIRKTTEKIAREDYRFEFGFSAR
jgi:hypothetical protein